MIPTFVPTLEKNPRIDPLGDFQNSVGSPKLKHNLRCLWAEERRIQEDMIQALPPEQRHAAVCRLMMARKQR